MREFLIGIFLLSAISANAGTQSKLRESAKLYQNQNYTKALQNYKEILQKQQTNQEALFGLGTSSYQLKDYNSAISSFEKISSTNGELNQDATFNLANTYYKANQKEQAIETYKKAILKNPNDKEAIHNLQLILSQNQKNNNDQNKQDKGQKSSDNSKQDNQQNQSPAKQNKSKEDSKREMAERVMQMAKENEIKQSPTQQSAQASLVEKDW